MRKILINLSELHTLEVPYDCTLCGDDKQTKADICLQTYNNANSDDSFSIRHHNYPDETQFLCANHAEVLIDLTDENLLTLQNKRKES